MTKDNSFLARLGLSLALIGSVVFAASVYLNGQDRLNLSEYERRFLLVGCIVSNCGGLVFGVLGYKTLPGQLAIIIGGSLCLALVLFGSVAWYMSNVRF